MVAQGKGVRGKGEECWRARMAGPKLLLVVLCTLCTCSMASVPDFLDPTPNLGAAQNITGCDHPPNLSSLTLAHSITHPTSSSPQERSRIILPRAPFHFSVRMPTSGAPPSG